MLTQWWRVWLVMGAYVVVLVRGSGGEGGRFLECLGEAWVYING